MAESREVPRPPQRAEHGFVAAQRWVRRIWNSPTLMAWGNTAVRLLSFGAVLPLVLRRLSPEEITTWYVFVSLLGLQVVADTGFMPTFARAVAYAVGGAADVGDHRNRAGGSSGAPNWDLLGRIRTTSAIVYRRVVVIAAVFFAVAGTIAVVHPISTLHDTRSAWLAWLLVLVTIILGLARNHFIAFLHGVNRIALARRWEMLTSIGAVVSQAVVLILGGRLLALAIAGFVWNAVAFIREAVLSRAVRAELNWPTGSYPFDARVARDIWHRAWRSGLGVGASLGVMYAFGIIYAQIATPAAAASYLLAFRIAQAVSEFSQAPFYTKLPVMAALWAGQKKDATLSVAQRGMTISYWILVSGFIATAVLAPTGLQLIHSRIQFVPASLWALMAVSYFVERFGAMHMQLYSLTNHIVWHIANGVTGTVVFVATLLLLPRLDVYAFPIGILVGYLSFYSWWSTWLAWKAFDFSMKRFELRTAMGPLLLLVAYVVAATSRWLPQ